MLVSDSLPQAALGMTIGELASMAPEGDFEALFAALQQANEARREAILGTGAVMSPTP